MITEIAMSRKKFFFAGIVLVVLSAFAYGQGSYKQPPKEIMDVLNAPPIPLTTVSPAGDRIAMLEPLRYPPIADLAQPMLRLAGERVNPKSNGQHRQGYFVKLVFKNISDGKETPASLPVGAKIMTPQWAPDGKHMAFGNITPTGIELWVVDTATGKASRLSKAYVNTAFGGFGWEGSNELSATLVPTSRGPAPAYENVTPTEPNIQETSGRTGVVQTFEDLLKSPNDEKLFDYYATSQFALITLDGKVKNIGPPAIFDSTDLSPDGKYVLVSMIRRPYSYQFPMFRFPKKIEVWDMSGKPVHVIADIPLQDNLPAQGVPLGPRATNWIPTEPATLMWAEALDGGDPRKKVTPRDRLMTLAAPFSSQPAELLKTEQRYQGRLFGEKGGLMLYYDYNRDTQHRRVFSVDYRNAATSKMISDLNVNDRYHDIGQPVMKMLPTGSSVIRQNRSGDTIYMAGAGASPEGDRPFLRYFYFGSGQSDEVFRSGTDRYESVAAVLDDEGTRIVTRKESPTEPPNLYGRHICDPKAKCILPEPKQLTYFSDPTPQLRGITKQLVKYKRPDGVDLSFTLYLPPGYKQGTRLPAVVWAYPLEFTDASTAGQVSGSTNRFTQIGSYSHLFFLLEGYAVLDNTTMPIVGDPLTVNDTYIEQVVADAKAAIDKAAEMGVIDSDRVGVGGHSYGAFMTGNLMAHSRLFRAGIARSGAYNRTLTPFGFQSERRTFWEAPELYEKVSPFFYADKIKDPLLMIHGEADDNTGTFPIQSERMFAAISGNGGTARLVMLPLEAHGYIARETTEHVLYEMINWFDKYVKNAKPRQQTAEK
jgi:dipeptidyl aminopeptidase/acylaminoacyl peptidase